MSDRPPWPVDVETAERECQLCFDKWKALTNRIRIIVSQHEEYAPDAFKTSILELLPEYARAANAVVARLQIMVQIKCAEMQVHGDEPKDSDD